jgi:hypothetical protein
MRHNLSKRPYAEPKFTAISVLHLFYHHWSNCPMILDDRELEFLRLSRQTCHKNILTIMMSIRNWRPILDPMSVNLDKRPTLNKFYRQKVWENKVTIPAHKQNFFNAFVRFSWCFEGKSGICLVVYNLYIWLPWYFFYHRNVRMDRKLMFYDAVLTSIFISFVYSTLNG